ncbi:acyl-CoA N-acyltransferase [Gaertneriomyces semiglobifer]|nr:acyl-CoA N-acyltransferase [Gaertneriomyces semiglobifer]
MSNIILSLTEGITIRQWRDGDEADLASHANNRKIWQNLTDRFPHPYTLEAAQWWVNHCTDKKNWLPAVLPAESQTSSSSKEESVPSFAMDYAICYLDRPIGGCGLEYDSRYPRMARIGYWLGEAHWGTGIGSHVAREFSQWAFDTFPWIVRLEAEVYGWNEASQKILRKCGYELEGVQKRKVYKDGEYGDLALFAKLKQA